MKKESIMIKLMKSGFLYAQASAIAEKFLTEGGENLHVKKNEAIFRVGDVTYIARIRASKLGTFSTWVNGECIESMSIADCWTDYDSDPAVTIRILGVRNSWEPPKNPDHYVGHLVVI